MALHTYTDRIFRAAVDGSIDVVRERLAAGVSPNLRDISLETPLHNAVRSCPGNRLEIVKLLLAHGSDVDAASDGGRTALHLAAIYSRPECAAVLIAAGASLDVRSPYQGITSGDDCTGITPVEMLLDGAGSGPNEIKTMYLLLSAGAALPRTLISARENYDGKLRRYVEKVAATGSWAAYRAHTMRLAATLTKGTLLRLPHDIVAHVVRFAFHTGRYY